MISAFGVEHGDISKSQAIPPSAAQNSAAAMRGARNMALKFKGRMAATGKHSAKGSAQGHRLSLMNSGR